MLRGKKRSSITIRSYTVNIKSLTQSIMSIGLTPAPKSPVSSADVGTTPDHDDPQSPRTTTHAQHDAPGEHRVSPTGEGGFNLLATTSPGQTPGQSPSRTARSLVIKPVAGTISNRRFHPSCGYVCVRMVPFVVSLAFLAYLWDRWGPRGGGILLRGGGAPPSSTVHHVVLADQRREDHTTAADPGAPASSAHAGVVSPPPGWRHRKRKVLVEKTKSAGVLDAKEKTKSAGVLDAKEKTKRVEKTKSAGVLDGSESQI